MISAVIVAAGKGTRMGADKNKVFLDLCGKCILSYTLEIFLQSKADEIIVVTSGECFDDAEFLCKPYGIKVVKGGATRQESVKNGINIALGDIVCIHDGARPFVTAELVNRVIDDCMKHGAAALGVMPKDTVKVVSDNGFIKETIPRNTLIAIQTPQVFKKDDIIKCHNKALADGFEATDDCALMEYAGQRIFVTEGSYDNIKVTTPEDMIIGEQILKRQGRI